MLEDIIGETVYHDRIFCLTFDVTVPAGEYAEVRIEQHKEPSFDFYCDNTENTGVKGYDMVTKLGSSLDFSGQQAAITGYENIRIVRQNYGFDPEAGITEVELNTDEEYYWIEVAEKKEN